MLQEMKAEHSPGTGKYSPGLQDSGKTNGVVVSMLEAVVVLDSSRTNSSGTVSKKWCYFAVKSGKFATIMSTRTYLILFHKKPDLANHIFPCHYSIAILENIFATATFCSHIYNTFGNHFHEKK